MNSKIGFIGCGNMGEALVKGLLDKGIVKKAKILASDARASRRKYIQRRYKIKVTSSNETVAENCAVIILAVKPRNIDAALKSVRDKINVYKIIISIVAGVKIKHIQKSLPKCRLIRVMPNTPALVGSGITAICKSKTARAADFYLAKKLFSSVGNVAEVSEGLMDIVTATSGSGPAYFFLLAEAMIKAGVSNGLSRKTSEQLVLNTALGAAMLARDSAKPMSRLIKKVASKGGTTEAALEVFAKRGFENIVKEAVRAATKRSKELAKRCS